MQEQKQLESWEVRDKQDRQRRVRNVVTLLSVIGGTPITVFGLSLSAGKSVEESIAPAAASLVIAALTVPAAVLIGFVVKDYIDGH